MPVLDMNAKRKVVVTGVLLAALAGCGPTPGGAELSAVVACHAAVKDTLKSPRSAKFDNETATWVSGDAKLGAIRVTGDVDAENSFGAMIRARFTCGTAIQDGKAIRAQASLDES